MKRSLLSLLAAVALLAGPAFAAPAADVFKVLETQGLVGAWSEDCDSAPTQENGRETILLDGGRVVSIADEGQRYVVEIVSARVIDARDTELRIRARNGDERMLIYRREGDRQKTWAAWDDSGQRFIIDGMFANGVTPADWYERCPAPAKAF